ncbi:MAG: polysaccharide deacetylase family protein [Pseudonocardiaceae bacterium]
MRAREADLVMEEAGQLPRRRILRWTTQAALVGGLALGRPGRAVAAGSAPGDPAAGRAVVGPASRVRDVLPAAARNAVALTIDDGPDPVWTPQVLDLLHRNGIRATFSLIGVQAHAYPALVKRIVVEGHGVTNHSMTHPQPFSRQGVAAIRQQITDAQSVIAGASGVAPSLFRAPGGDWSAAVLSAVADLQMVPLGWDIDPRDWARPGIALVTARLLAARPGDILLCHDGGGDRAETLESLRTALPALTDRGLQFVTL